MASPEVSALRCITLAKVDWLIDTSNRDYVLATSYGRSPAVDVVMSPRDVSPGSILSDLGSAVEQLPASRRCL